MRVPLKEVVPHIACLSASTVGEAAEAPGIYAWYSSLAAGPKDWEFEMGSGGDLGIERLKKALARHSERFAVPSLAVNAVGRFTATWRGELASVGSVEFGEAVGTADAADESAFARVLATPRLRAALVRTLGLATPLLAAPLYIGVSDNLNRRLGEHVADLHKYAAAVAREPSSRPKLASKGTNFAMRAIGSGFTLENLEVWALDLSLVLNPDFAALELRDLAEAAEWLLNRWYRPLHGKR